MILQESLYTPETPEGRLHLRHIHPERDLAEPERAGTPVLMLHGALENSRIFYSLPSAANPGGRGLAPYLASHGFDVYAGDLRGRGLSEPPISRDSRHGQLESICEEIPAMARLIQQRRPEKQQIWVAHSWGGVLMLSSLARLPELKPLVKGLVFFGTKRSIHVGGIEKFIKIDFFWNRAARALIRAHGYLPGRRYRVGADDETALSHEECAQWVEPGLWVDPRDGFDYRAQFHKEALPPMLFLAGLGDKYLGHPSDVRALIRELGPQEVEFRLLARATGNRHDYGHVDMLTHPDATEDHFPDALKWIRGVLRES